jgi:hypothetical protein
MMDSQQVSLVIVGEVDRAAISADADEILQGQAIRGLHQPENSLYGHIRIPSSCLSGSLHHTLDKKTSTNCGGSLR